MFAAHARAAVGVAVLAVLAVLAAAPALTARPQPADAGDPDQLLVDLVYKNKTLNERAFAKGEDKKVREAFARHFETKYASDLADGFGPDADALRAWLNDNPEVRDLLYTAIEPGVDNVPKAAEVFHDLWKADAAAVKAHPNLAVAVAVVWDNPQAVYDYRGHQVRTKSLLPETVKGVGPAENFRSVVDRAAKLKGVQLQLPWEFLAHVVNHRTPDDEREWAVKNYLARRAGVGTAYTDIVYDKEMLRTKSEVCKLNGKPYTLPGIKEFGGVCAMQADFAARVSKSISVPAEYVGGEANSGGLHAWVVWAEVRSITKDQVTFSLESAGRYFFDQYYVGTLTDPRSGLQMTDRDMDRRLTAVGSAPHSARQADLLMRAFPAVRDQRGATVKEQQQYLNKVLALYPMSERAWLELAAMHKDGKLTDAPEASRLADKALVTFARFPDFSWQVVGDLLTPQKDKVARTRVHEKMAAGYESLGRPDLACEARLALVGYQVEAGDNKKAFDGLAGTVRRFPAEGRYVPKMTAKMEEVARNLKNGPDLTAKFYLETLPLVPPKRGAEVSDYCVRLHEQAIAFLRTANKTREAAQVEQNLARVKGR
ncbi:MAG TPA: hypothetical protein VH092_17665 [Urbifossiella sp.]|jgi:hypothetical protein|nr:hypothetical protein [Urbifossiella sp.]